MKTLIGAVTVVFGMLGIGIAVIAKATYPSLAGWSPHLYTAGALSPFILGTAFAVSRSQHRSLMNSFSRPFIFSWMGCIGLIAGGVEYTNGHFDSAPGVTHSVTVASKHVTQNKRSKSYSLTISSWREGRSTEEIDVSKDVFDSVEAGSSKLNVVSHPGVLGME